MLLYTEVQRIGLRGWEASGYEASCNEEFNGDCMLLIGRDLSPFVRRCATVFNLLGLPYERKSVATEVDGDFIREHNPLGRVPALVLTDGVVIDSAAIIDYALDTAVNGNHLLSATGPQRRETLLFSALATGVMEKAVASAYEVTMRPKELVHATYLERLQRQAFAGLEALNANLQKDYFGGDTPNLADVNAVIAYDQLLIVSPATVSKGKEKVDRLAQLSERANTLPAFSATRWQPKEA